MKSLSIVLLALLLAGPCIAMNDTDEAYIQGLEAGYGAGRMSITGLTNATIEDTYNSR